MIKIKKLETPAGYMSCYSCGDKNNDIKRIEACNTITLNGRTRVVNGNKYCLILCAGCRQELRGLLRK